LHAHLSTDQLATALELALQQQCWSAVGVDRLRCLARGAGEPVPGTARPTTSDDRAALASLTIPPPDLTRFDRLWLLEEVPQ
jgi:hypothetical protein